MNRKFLAGVLATSLVLTAAPVVPGMEVNADAEELSIGSQTGGGYLDLIGSSRAATDGAVADETLTGTAWWEGNQTGKDYTLKGDGTLDLYVEYAGGLDNGAFNVELVSDGDKYITTGSNIDIWTSGAEGTVEGKTEEMAAITKGHEYKISVAREGKDFTITYFDVTDNKEHCKLTAANTNMGESVGIHVIAQVGIFNVSVPGYVAPEEPDDPTTPPTDDPTTTPPTDDPTDPPVTGDTEILTGTAWWEGSQKGKDYTLTGDGTLDLFIGYIGGLDAGAFSVELVSDGNKYITTGSDINIWTAEGAKDQGEILSGGVLGGVITPGHKYKVSVTREGKDFTIIYFDMTSNKEHCKLTAANTNLGEEVNIHVMAQVGKYMVSTSDFDMPEVNVTTPKPLAPYPVVLPTPEPLPTLPPADENVTPEPTPVLEPETITGTAWWDAANERSRDYVLKGAGTLDLYVTFDSTSDSAGYGAFNVELVSDGNKYITTGSDTNAWTGEQGTGTVSCPNLTNSTIVPGHVYKISVKRTNYDFTIIYYDLTDNKEYCTMEIKDTNQAVDVNVHVMAQVGKYIVSQKAPDSVTPSASATPAPSAGPSASPDPSVTPEPGSTEAPGTTDPGTTPGDKDPGTSDPGDKDPAENPSDDDDEKDKETKKTMKVSDITAKAGKKKVTGKLSVKGTKVTVKIGNKKAKNAKVSGKKFTFTASSKLKKGTKVTIKVTKSGYKAVTKTVKVK